MLSRSRPTRPTARPPTACLHFPRMLAQPSKDSDRFAELVTFMSHVAPCYKKETKEFGPQLKSLLEQHGPVLVSERGEERKRRGVDEISLRACGFLFCDTSSSNNRGRKQSKHTMLVFGGQQQG